MTTLLILSSLAAAALTAVHIARYRRRRQPDPALTIKPPVQKFSGWDEQKQRAGAERARARVDARRRAEAGPKVEAGKHEGADVMPMEQRRIR